MIKLNNKNITYVALADSNNSIKAPKEIWYADSSNSVKLVYRRKDALIEGVDYEKYHWLKGRNGAYINTNHKLNAFEDSFQIKAKIDDPTAANPSGGENDIFGYMQDNGYRCIAFYARNTGRLFFAYSNISRGGSQVYFANKTDFIATLSADGSNFTATCDGVAQIATVGNLPQGEYGDITIFRFGQILTSADYFHGDISYFNIEPNKIRMIPCKLLKPVPKWLDANGIRRQVGECGMIDLISGKFYGNVNSVGTFTVENYYERKEWLCGRNGAYINTNYYLNTIEDSFDCHFRWDGATENPLGNLNGVFGNYSNNVFARVGIRYGKYFIDYKKSDGSFNMLNIQSPYDVEIHLRSAVDKYSFELNGTHYEYSNNAMEQIQLTSPVYVFENIANNGTYFHGDIAYFKITDTSSNTKMNLIPCTLTMDLPASMDANNIARTKGTSGMWDLVSDRFYGNVANSGTFKAVNLAEGVDYEMHQWLIIPYTQNNANALPIKSNNFSYQYIIYSVGNIAGLWTENTKYAYYPNLTKCSIWGYSEQTVVHINSNLIPLGTPFDVECDSNGITMNGELMPNYGSSPYFDRLAIYCRTSTGQYALSKITVDGSVRYIPVKLLRPIPSKYDANGIARNAGECGMYDTVNDVFYGNVASSGTFTVSDDS